MAGNVSTYWTIQRIAQEYRLSVSTVRNRYRANEMPPSAVLDDGTPLFTPERVRQLHECGVLVDRPRGRKGKRRTN